MLVLLFTALSAFVLPGVAGAATYAVSTNTITGFSFVFGAGTSLSPFTFSGDSAALNGTGDSHVGATDAAASCVGAFCTGFSNSFVAHGAATPYAYGDSQIMNVNVTAGTGAAAAIAEASVDNGSAHATGTNTMIGSMTVTTPGAVSFGFTADPYLESIVGANGIANSAVMSFEITLRDSLGGLVFRWTPDGALASGITGGTESADPFTLNTGITGNTLVNDSSAAFAAASASIAAGTYQLNITMSNNIFVNAQTVPVPPAAWLFGAGLLGLAGISRRK